MGLFDLWDHVKCSKRLCQVNWKPFQGLKGQTDTQSEDNVSPSMGETKQVQPRKTVDLITLLTLLILKLEICVSGDLSNAHTNRTDMYRLWTEISLKEGTAESPTALWFLCRSPLPVRYCFQYPATLPSKFHGCKEIIVFVQYWPNSKEFFFFPQFY